MAIQLVSAHSLALNHGVKCMTYGRAGMGKTMLTATAPNPVLISAESGVLSLKRENIERVWGVNSPGICYNIPVIQITTLQDLIEAEVWCRTSAEAGQFQTICLDSITEIAEAVLENAKGQVKDPRQAYGELITQMQKVIKSFRDLKGKHVYMSAKEERFKDESTGITLAGPMMPGAKLGPSIGYLFDEVFQLTTGKNPDNSVYRYLKTQPDFSADAKDRSGALAPVEFPHLGSVFAKIMAGQPIQQ